MVTASYVIQYKNIKQSIMRCSDVLIFPRMIHFKCLFRNISYQMLSEIFSPIIRFPLPSSALSLRLSCLLGIQLCSDPRPVHSLATVIPLIHHLGHLGCRPTPPTCIHGGSQRLLERSSEDNTLSPRIVCSISGQWL